MQAGVWSSRKAGAAHHGHPALLPAAQRVHRLRRQVGGYAKGAELRAVHLVLVLQQEWGERAAGKATLWAARKEVRLDACTADAAAESLIAWHRTCGKILSM